MQRIFDIIFNSPKRRFVMTLAVIAFILRVAYISTLEEKWYFMDTVHYDTAARNIIAGNGFGPSVYFSNLYKDYCLEPLYPLFLAGVYKVAGHSLYAARIAQAVVGVAAILLLYWLAAALASNVPARLTLIFSAIYPFYIYIAGLLYITQIFALFIIITIVGFFKYYHNQRIRWIIFAGIFLALGVLARPVFILSIPLFLLWILFFSPGTFGKKILVCLVLGLTIGVVFTPWTIRNYLVFGKPKYARACLPQGQVYGQTFWKIKQTKVLEQNSVDVKKFTVWYHNDESQSVLDCYLDDKYFFTLVPYYKIDQFDSSGYFGVLFSGQEPNNLQRLVAKKRTVINGESIDSLVYDSAESIKNFMAAPEISVSPTEIEFSGGPEDWKYPMVFDNNSPANLFELYYPESISPQKLQKIALLMQLDKPGLSGNGYMVWLHPWQEPDFWWIRDGLPYDSVPVLKTFTDEKKLSLFNMVKKYPFEFFFEHFMPEFINFWSPTITRVISEGKNPGKALQGISILFFTPLLILFPIGIWSLRNKIQILCLYLVPIITLSFGYSLFFTQTRYRIPVDSFLILFAAQGFYYLFSRIFRHHFNRE